MLLHTKQEFENRIKHLEKEVLDEKQYSDKLRREIKELQEQISELISIMEEDI